MCGRPLMRVLALDYGSARCGCALSDPTGTIATPIAAVTRPSTKRGMVSLRELALRMQSGATEPFLAPWWLSPSLAYWSGQPAVAGSSHESMVGIVDTARFYATADLPKARQILENRKVGFVIGYDEGRTAATSGQILGQLVPEHAVCYMLDRAPATSPAFLVLDTQNPAGKLFRVANNR